METPAKDERATPEDDTTCSTRSSYIESPSTDADPESLFSRPQSTDDLKYPLRDGESAQLHDSALTFSSSSMILDQEGGYLNKSFSNLSDHVEAGLPPVIVIEDPAAPKGNGDDLPVVEIVSLSPGGHHVGKEGLKTLILQIFIPFILAGFGMVGAGILLDLVQVCVVFTIFRSLFMSF